MTAPPAALLEFPCAYPIKAMGAAAGGLERIVVDIVRRHVAAIAADAMRVRPSRNGRYVAVTVTVQIESRAQLEAIYAELAAHDSVLMTL